MDTPAPNQQDEPASRVIRIGVLALQGSFREHISAIRRCVLEMKASGAALSIEALEIRTEQELRSVHALIIPGGESTTMANLAERSGLICALQSFASSGRPMWGTCAGLIFLANRAMGQKTGGQALLGGLDCTVHRNFFGSQINSFEAFLPFPTHTLNKPATTSTTVSSSSISNAPSPSAPFRAVFIRAPAIIETGPEVEVLAEYPLANRQNSSSSTEGAPAAAAAVPAGQGASAELSEAEILAKLERVAVAVRQGALMATAFHPELTADLRWHQLFLNMVIAQAAGPSPSLDPPPTELSAASSSSVALTLSSVDPGDLPVFGSTKNMAIELKPLGR